MRLGAAEFLRAATPDELANTRAFYAARTGGVGPRSRSELLAARAARTVDPAGPSRTVEHVIDARDHRLPVRVTVPRRGPVGGVYLYIHGGGFYLDRAARDDTRHQRLADARGIAVVAVDYRLAPESPWPAAPDDCEATALWLLDRARSLFGTTRLVIGGMSAGSTLVMTTLLRLRDRGLAQRFSGAVLEAGTYDLSASTPPGRIIAGEYFIEAYLGHIRDRSVPDISPIFGELHQLPSTLIVIGTEDVLLADNLAMAARLKGAGNDVDPRLYPQVPHGFTRHATPIGRRAAADIDDWIAWTGC